MDLEHDNLRFIPDRTTVLLWSNGEMVSCTERQSPLKCVVVGPFSDHLLQPSRCTAGVSCLSGGAPTIFSMYGMRPTSSEYKVCLTDLTSRLVGLATKTDTMRRNCTMTGPHLLSRPPQTLIFYIFLLQVLRALSRCPLVVLSYGFALDIGSILHLMSEQHSGGNWASFPKVSLVSISTMLKVVCLLAVTRWKCHSYYKPLCVGWNVHDIPFLTCLPNTEQYY